MCQAARKLRSRDIVVLRDDNGKGIDQVRYGLRNAARKLRFTILVVLERFERDRWLEKSYCKLGVRHFCVLEGMRAEIERLLPKTFAHRASGG